MRATCRKKDRERQKRNKRIEKHGDMSIEIMSLRPCTRRWKHPRKEKTRWIGVIITGQGWKGRRVRGLTADQIQWHVGPEFGARETSMRQRGRVQRVWKLSRRKYMHAIWKFQCKLDRTGLLYCIRQCLQIKLLIHACRRWLHWKRIIASKLVEVKVITDGKSGMDEIRKA